MELKDTERMTLVGNGQSVLRMHTSQFRMDATYAISNFLSKSVRLEGPLTRDLLGTCHVSKVHRFELYTYPGLTHMTRDSTHS